MAISQRCSATKADGTPCNAWAVRGSNPPLCKAHGGRRSTFSPPPSNPLTIVAVVADLFEKQRYLSAYIDAHQDELDTSAVARLLALHGQNASRLGRLLRDQQALSGDAADGISGAIALALDELSVELGTDI